MEVKLYIKVVLIQLFQSHFIMKIMNRDNFCVLVLIIFINISGNSAQECSQETKMEVKSKFLNCMDDYDHHFGQNIQNLNQARAQCFIMISQVKYNTIYQINI